MSHTSNEAQTQGKAEMILHPTDLSPASDLALAHAIRLAITNQAQLRIFHVVDDEQEEDWSRFPSVREILCRWGMIPENADRSAVTALGVQIEKVIGRDKSVADSIERYCTLHPIDMVILSTQGRDGLAAWIEPSTSERIANKIAPMMIPVLFVPEKCKGCVSLESGRSIWSMCSFLWITSQTRKRRWERGCGPLPPMGVQNRGLLFCMWAPLKNFQRLRSLKILGRSNVSFAKGIQQPKSYPLRMKAV